MWGLGATDVAKAGFHALGTHSRETLQETRGWGVTRGGIPGRTYLAVLSGTSAGHEELERHPQEEAGTHPWGRARGDAVVGCDWTSEDDYALVVRMFAREVARF